MVSTTFLSSKTLRPIGISFSSVSSLAPCLHLTCGIGEPTATHVRLTSAPGCTSTFSGAIEKCGGTRRTETYEWSLGWNPPLIVTRQTSRQKPWGQIIQQWLIPKDIPKERNFSEIQNIILCVEDFYFFGFFIIQCFFDGQISLASRDVNKVI